ncbi:hypothetical protein [Ferruginibacter albus]|nr:hypothetical protein [Ferruginibacter albus]UAY52398.1 hypothetical protein K9M53_01585 [Ferruginibacter albus]
MFVFLTVNEDVKVKQKTQQETHLTVTPVSIVNFIATKKGDLKIDLL